MTTPLIKGTGQESKIGLENKLPISAIVVSCNEGHLLEDCLKSIQFCEEIVLIDLESKDTTPEIGRKWATKILTQPPVLIVEKIHKKVIPGLKFDWVLLTDPDERIDKLLYLDLRQTLKTISNNIGEINVPIQYYFKNIKLSGTIWGGIDRVSRCLINKKMVVFSENVHQGYCLKNDCRSVTITRKEGNVIHHFWGQSFHQLFSKHKRYVAEEGRRQYFNGMRYSFPRHCRQTLSAFKSCYLLQKGYKDGLLGLFLSFFWMWYVYRSWNALKKYQKNIETGLHD